MTRLLGRAWLPVVVMIVVAVGAFSVDRTRTFFGAHATSAAAGASGDDITPFNPKVVTYEIFGPPGTLAGINYLDLSAQPRQVVSAALPWSLTLSTTAPSAFANIVAQGDSNIIGCRITVDGKVMAENTSYEVNAQTFCLAKSA